MNTPFFEKLIEALMSENPSGGIEKLRESGELGREVPELTRMVGAHHDRNYHAEDVWEHTMMVIDLAASIKDQVSDPVRFMVSALFHDTGKPVTEESHIDVKTHERVYHNVGHPAAGAFVAVTALRRLTDDRALLDYVFDFVGHHHVVYEIDQALAKNGGVVDEEIHALLHLGQLRDYVLFNREADSRGVIPGAKSGKRPDRFLAAYAEVDPEWAGRY